MSAAPSPLLLRLLLALEIPDCGCPRVVVPACVRAGRPCPGDCDCPQVPGTPCEHAFHADDVFFSLAWASELIEDGGAGAGAELLRRWAARLLAADPAAYAEPPRPADVLLGPEVSVRVAVMAARWGDDPDRPRHAIRHPADAGKGSDDRLATGRVRLMNGADRETGLRVYDPDADAPAPEAEDEIDRRLRVVDGLLKQTRTKLMFRTARVEILRRWEAKVESARRKKGRKARAA